jgi:putative transposase
VQTCVVHLVRNSLRYASKADWQPITRGLRKIYTAPTVEAASVEFDAFADRWAIKYPALIDMWQRMWDDFVPFLEFPTELRTIVYTTNAIESMNARLRRGVRQRGHFPNEQAAMKVLYLIAIHRKKNRENMTGRIAGWKQILNTLTIHYGDRIEAVNQ